VEETLVDILDMCFVRIQAGASVEDCLAAFPQHRVEIEGPLRLATQLSALPRPMAPSTTRATLETQLLALAAQRRTGQMPAATSNGATPPSASGRVLEPAALLAGFLRALGYRGPLAQTWLRVASVAIAILLALALGTGVVAAARAIVRAIQAPSSTSTTTLPASTPFTLDGPIEQIAPERWVVNGFAVAIDSQTVVSGAPSAGAIAHIRGILQADGVMLAQTIEIVAAQPTAVRPVPALPTTPPTPQPAPAPAPPPAGEPDKPDKPKPDKPDKPKPGKPDKPKPGKGDDKGKD
jgi:hypothetical protein